MLPLAHTALAAALHLASPPASGFSAHDPTGERILLGALEEKFHTVDMFSAGTR